MDPRPPFDHPHHRRAHPGHHYPDPHHRHYADQHLAGGIGGGAAPARSRFDYDSHPIQYLSLDHQHHLPRIHHQPPPPPPPPHHRLDAPHYPPVPLRAPPETCAPPPYRSLCPHHHHHPQRHGGDDFRAVDEIRCLPGHHHHHHQPQLLLEEAEKERRRYAALQLRLSPPDSRKRHRCALHDSGDHEITSSSGPPPRRQRQHQHTSYSSDESFGDRASFHSGYSRYEGFVMHNDSDRKIQTSASAMLPDSPHKIDAGYPRHAPQKSAAARVSECQQIEENPSMCALSSQHQLPKEVDISPPKKKNAGYASKKLASVISLDCKAISPSKTKSTGSESKELSSVISLDHKAKSVNGNNTGDNGGTKKSTGKNSDKVLASVLVKPSPESKEKGKSVKQVTRKPDKVQNNVPGFSNGSAGLTARPVIGAKKVKKIVIKKIVRKIGASNKQTSSTVTPEQKDGVDANANECEKEEGEITTSSYEKDDSSAQNLISTSDTAHVGSSVLAETEQNDCFINPCKRNATSAIESAGFLDTASVSGSQHPEKEDDRSLTKTGDTNATSVVDSAQVLDTIGSEHPGDRGCMDLGGQSAALLCENSISHVEEDGIAVSGAMNVVVASNSPRTPDTMKLQEYNVLEVMTGNNAACVNGVKDDTKQVGESTNSRRANSNKKDHKKMEFIMDENIQKKESQMSIYSNTLKTTHHIESPNRTEIFSYGVCGSEVCRGHNDSDETLIRTLDNSIDTPDYVLAGGTKDSRTQELLHDQRIVLDKSNLHHEAADMGFSNFPLAKNVESAIKLLDGDPTEDSSAPIISNKDVGNATISQAAELIHLQRADLSPANSEHSLPTALTLGKNTYFSSVGSEQPKENHKLMESSKGLDNVTEADFDRIEKGKSELDNDLINADAHNWLTLPMTVNYVTNDTTVSLDRFDLEQNVDEDTSVSQDHGSMVDMDQCGGINSFNGEDHNLKLSCSYVSESDLLELKGRNKNIKNQSEIVLPESSVCSVNVLDQHGYCAIGKPIVNTNNPVIISSQSAGVTGGELASSEVHVGSGNTNHSNTMDLQVESSTKPDLLSSWMEAIVSEDTKEHQPCKSTPDMLFGLKDDTRKTLPAPLINSVSKSPPSMSTASSTVPKVPAKPVALLSSSREVPCLNQNARHKTWHRDNLSSCKSHLAALQPSGLPPKLPLKKNDKTHKSCYIRKGNALIRNPATGNHAQFSSSALDAPSKSNKPIMKRSMNFVRKADSNGTVAHSNVSVERPKTPPLPLHTKSITTNISEPVSQSLQKQQVPETEKKDSSGHVNSGVDNPSVSSVQKSDPLDAGKVVYARPKSNQLVASQGQQSGDSINSSMDKVLLQPSTTSDLYFKKRKNQIILGPSTSDALSSKEMNQAENSNTDETKVLMLASSNKNPTVAKDRPHKALQTPNTVGSFSHVWTLSGQLPHRKLSVGTSHRKAFPCILPWKRKVFSHNYRSNYSSLLNTSSLGIVRKLMKTRKRSTVYTVSTNGFSLRKSGLLSCDGSSLKWSRSLQKDSQKEATLAVSETDRKKRERRKRQSLRNKGTEDQYSISVAARKSNHTSSDSRVPSTSNEYVRINKGNQLVRNPKKVIRMLASEKVRWSLHTVRSRLAKKQQYCQFFTRFGECKKSGGNCPYIHDRAKVAICTKFLKGLCSNASCKLTHKVLPERMPDCSYFLQGLCSNTTCPYRHVKVNTNAPVCEDFLKGYCADGDECRKKHSYVCPVFDATGECPQQSRCKLHHPKKKIKSKKSRVDTLQNNSWGRYFDSSIGEDSEAMRVCSEEDDKQKQEHATGGDLADFIDLGTEMDGYVDVDVSDEMHLMELDSRNIKMQADNLDALIKPLRIMRTARI